MFDNEKRSHIERTKKGLYSRNGEVDDFTVRKPVHIVGQQVENDWQAPPSRLPVFAEPEKKVSIFKIILIASLVFFVVALGAALYAFLGGSQSISVDNIDIVVEGPVSISGGEIASFNVSLVNKNATTINMVDLFIEFPEGTKEPTNVGKSLTRKQISFDSIKASSVASEKIEAVMFGTENERKTIRLTVEYRTEDSNAIFYKEKTYEIVIASSPILLDIKALDKLSSGQEAEIEITVSSNATSPIENLLMSVDYPFGFTFTSANPAPTFGSNIFSVGDLSPTGKRTFVIKGTLVGENDEERILRASVGIKSQSNEREIATSIISSEHDFKIEKPFVSMILGLNGTLSGDYGGSSGSQIRADIEWTNNLPVRVANGVVEVKISGNILDKNSISSTKGLYSSLNNTITWDSRNNSNLALISPGDTGKFVFSFSSLRFAPGSYPSNPEIKISLTFKGSRVDEGDRVVELSGNVSRIVKISSEPVFVSESFFDSGPFANSGPIPPKVDQKTTYTVVWTISSTGNSMSNAEARAVLPPYVEWLGVSSDDSSISFNSVGGEVVWNIGDIPQAMTGAESKKQIFFQVAVTPNINDVKKVLGLIGKVSVSAVDDFSGQVSRIDGRAVTTFTSDAGSTKDRGTVVE